MKIKSLLVIYLMLIGSIVYAERICYNKNDKTVYCIVQNVTESSEVGRFNIIGTSVTIYGANMAVLDVIESPTAIPVDFAPLKYMLTADNTDYVLK